MSLEFQFKGRKLSANQFFDRLAKEILQRADDNIEDRLRILRHPKTGQALKVTKRTVGEDTIWSVAGRPEAVKMARKILKGDFQ